MKEERERRKRGKKEKGKEEENFHLPADTDLSARA